MNDTRVRVAQDEVIFAERAVAMLEEERAERVRDVEGLDGTLTAAWTRLTGTREARIEAAVRAVEEVDRRLAAARARLVAARGQADGVSQAREQQKQAVVERVRAVRERLDELVAAGGPLGGRIDALRLERELLAERFALADEAAVSGSQLVAGLQTVVHSSRRVEHSPSAQMQLGGQVGAAVAAVARLAELEAERLHAGEGLKSAADAIERFRTAVSGLGSVFEGEAPSTDPAWLAWSTRDFDQNTTQAVDLIDRVRTLLISIDRERRELQSRLADIDAELERVADLPVADRLR